MKPLVSVICVCYNHARFVLEALNSVKDQTYSSIELIIVDDGSNDQSAEIINQWVIQNPSAKFLNLKTNHGYCVAFNKGFAKATGEFTIDLAADDVLEPNRIMEGVEGFLVKGEQFGIQFSDASYINTEGQVLRKHSDRFPHQTVPQGEVFTQIISRYFISPTVMVRKSVLDKLGGYDENLHYEDFDLWVRVARTHWFFYIPKILVRKRIVTNSLGQKQYTWNSDQMQSTYLVCKKIFYLIRNEEERRALNKRILCELKWNIRFLHLRLITRYLILWLRNNF